MISNVASALVLLIVIIAHTAVGHSLARNPLNYLEILEASRINSPKGRVHAYSHFEIELESRLGQEIKLRLEPNHDVIGEGATVSYIGTDGAVTHTETIDRTDHRVFKGTAHQKNVAGAWEEVGWSRITVLRDGIRPLFEGAFSVRHDNHHIKLRSSYTRTKHALDPHLEEEDDEFMVLYRDSDVAPSLLGRSLRQDQCLSHQLDFNSRPDHPVYTGTISKEDGQWGEMSMGRLFGKRQIDTQSTGNSAGVNLTSSIGQSAGCPSTRRVALVGVATDCGYTASFNSTQTARANIISVMNAASSSWESAFNISLGLQNLTIMDANCPGTSQAATPWNRDCGSNLDITARLNLFSAWRGTLSDTNSHWTLFTQCPTGDAVGLAWLGQACVHDAMTSNSTSGVSETVSGTNVVAPVASEEWAVVSHETGHTFGAVHDCTASTCSDGITLKSQQCCPHASNLCSETDQLYIMNPYTTSAITAFSPCSIGNICSAIGRNSVNTTCLSTNKNIPTISGAQCGNGIVEEGEDCDCGGPSGCADDACCNPTTCKFSSGAVCDDANDDCCSSCQYSASGTICRESTGSCDPAETCTGSSGTCPANTVAPDGTSCTLSNSSTKGLQCASGQCTSRDLQCRTIMSGYITNSNETYACDESNCLLSCASPAFGPGACYGLQQNLLDGTPCAGNGQCSNGQCKGATLGGQVKSWIEDHKAVVIGIAAGLGLLLVLTVLSCFCGCVRRARAARRKAPPSGGRLQRPPVMMEQQQQQQMPPPPQGYGWGYPPQQQNGWNGPVPPPMQPSFYNEAVPQSPPLSPQHQVLHGAGIIGSRPQMTPNVPGTQYEFSAPAGSGYAVRAPPAYPMGGTMPGELARYA